MLYIRLILLLYIAKKKATVPTHGSHTRFSHTDPVHVVHKANIIIIYSQNLSSGAIDDRLRGVTHLTGLGGRLGAGMSGEGARASA